jgi:cytoskeletal protein RodZ
MVPVDPHAMFPTEIDPRVPAPPKRRRLAVGMLAVLIVGVLTAWALWPTGPAIPAPEVSETSAPAPTRDETSPAAGDAPAAPTGKPAMAPDSRVTELTTTRNVWVRVIADGERVLEREVPAGSRIPITAQKTIVIRTGDAGAVTLTIAGQDQGTLGREGQVVTRTFTVPGQ